MYLTTFKKKTIGNCKYVSATSCKINMLVNKEGKY